MNNPNPFDMGLYTCTQNGSTPQIRMVCRTTCILSAWIVSFMSQHMERAFSAARAPRPTVDRRWAVAG